jgi:RES domain-containing protein
MERLIRLAPSLARPIRGRFCRATADDTDVLDIEGSRDAGGRYNPPGEFGALYCSESERLCLLEWNGSAAEQDEVGVVPVEVDLEQGLDLLDEAVLSAVGLVPAQLMGEGHELTRSLGRAVRQARLEGMLVPSARGPGRNLVVFLDRLRPASRVEALLHDRTCHRPPSAGSRAR